MGMPAARVGDMHVCPMFDGPKPHVGGPILPPCAVTVLTGGPPQARVGDMCTCVGPPDAILMGAMTVIVMGKPAARMLDTTVHGGKIVVGLPTVLIGDAGGGAAGSPKGNVVVGQAGVAGPANDPKEQAKALTVAAKEATPFCAACNQGAA